MVKKNSPGLNFSTFTINLQRLLLVILLTFWAIKRECHHGHHAKEFFPSFYMLSVSTSIHSVGYWMYHRGSCLILIVNYGEIRRNLMELRKRVTKDSFEKSRHLMTLQLISENCRRLNLKSLRAKLKQTRSKFLGRKLPKSWLIYLEKLFERTW